jgi:hypothetical protein
MNHETMQVFSGSPITPEELLVIADFAAPSHFVSKEHLHEAAENVAEWTDHRPSTINAALRLAERRGARRSVVDLLVEARAA